MTIVLLILFYFIVPALIIHYAGKYLLLKKAGSVLLAYIIGLIVGNTGIIPYSPETESFQKLLMGASMAFALPMLLISLNLSNMKNLAKNTFISLFTGVFSVIVVVVIAHFIFKNFIPDEWKVSGMLVGVYTGGTPNLGSIQAALNVDPDTYIFTHSSDLIISAAYLLFLMTIGKKVFSRFLPYNYYYGGRFNTDEVVFSNFEDYSDFFKKHNFLPTLASLGVTAVIVIIGLAISEVVPKELSDPAAILIITTLGIAASFIPDLRRGPKNFETGMYFIIVFSLIVSSMADFSRFSQEALPIFFNVAFVIVFSLLLHSALARLFKIDSDTVIITSTALICSPPFVPLIAGSLNNRRIIVSGLTVGLIGYAIGNYLGMFVAYYLRFL
jgi:uncharacterized membrane protein